MPTHRLDYFLNEQMPQQYFFTVATFAIWFPTVLVLWWLTWNTEGIIVPMLASLPGYLLLALAGAKNHGLAFAVLECLGTTLIVGTVGLLLDRCRLPRKCAWAYSLGFVLAPLVVLVGLPFNMVSVLFYGCMGVYLVSLLLLVGCGAARTLRWLQGK